MKSSTKSFIVSLAFIAAAILYTQYKWSTWNAVDGVIVLVLMIGSFGNGIFGIQQLEIFQQKKKVRS